MANKPSEEQWIAMVVLAMMRTLKSEEVEEKELRKEADEKRKETERLEKCLHEVLHCHGQFNGKNVTRYLKAYLMEFSIYKLSDKVAIREFPVLVEPNLKDLVERIESSSKDWEAFKIGMKDKFQFEDVDRVTQTTFLDWINDRNKKLKGPQELLREFNRKLVQLPTQEARVIELQRSILFLRAASETLREELENAMDLLDPKCLELTDDWA
ncbi:unnamed protein product [Calypogeia fissa]